MTEEQHTMAGETIDMEAEARRQEQEDAARTEPPPVDDVLSPSSFVEMFHPDNPVGSNGEPQYSTVSSAAFEQVYQAKGWQLRPDPYARPAEEVEASQVEAEQVAQPAEPQAEEAVVEAPNDKE